MKTKFITLNPNNNESPVYISHEQFENAYYIPNDVKIVVVDFKGEYNGNKV